MAHEDVPYIDAVTGPYTLKLPVRIIEPDWYRDPVNSIISALVDNIF